MKEKFKKNPVLKSSELKKIKEDLEEIKEFVVEETEEGLRIDFAKE
jgi:hypothetical protein